MKVRGFADNVVRLLVHPEERHIQERQALAYAGTLPTWDKVSNFLTYGEICTRLTDISPSQYLILRRKIHKAIIIRHKGETRKKKSNL